MPPALRSRVCIKLCHTHGFATIPNQAPTKVISEPGDITLLLRQWSAGDRETESKLFELLLPDLRKIARRHFHKERPGHTLQPTALVNEAFLRLVRTKDIDWQDRRHFFAIAGRVMRRYLVDHSRARPDIPLLPLEGLPERALTGKDPAQMAVVIDELLEKLQKENPQRCTVVELKFILGLTDEEAADTLSMSLHTFQREWYRARLWLFQRLSADPCKTRHATNAS